MQRLTVDCDTVKLESMHYSHNSELQRNTAWPPFKDIQYVNSMSKGGELKSKYCTVFTTRLHFLSSHNTSSGFLTVKVHMVCHSSITAKRLKLAVMLMRMTVGEKKMIYIT